MRFFLILVAALITNSAVAAGSNYPLENIELNYRDTKSLQRGMATYSHYCMGCHSLQYQRYERTAIDLKIDLGIMVDTIVPPSQKIGDLGTIAMPTEGAANWFGAPPPDLTLVARKRSPEWVFTYLKTFYTDPSRPLGVNNKVFPKVGMPHVLEPLQGVQKIVCKDTSSGQIVNENIDNSLGSINPENENQCGVLELVEGTGRLSAEEYDQLIYDLVNFLEYVGEPSKADSHGIGLYVLLFLMVFFVFSYLLKREYWKDVH